MSLEEYRIHWIHRLTQISNYAIIFLCIDEFFERLKSLDELGPVDI